MPAIDLKSSIDMCALLPLPPDAYDSLPGWPFAYAMNSATLFAGIDGLITITFGAIATWLTGAKSRWMSYGSFE